MTFLPHCHLDSNQTMIIHYPSLTLGVSVPNMGYSLLLRLASQECTVSTDNLGKWSSNTIKGLNTQRHPVLIVKRSAWRIKVFQKEKNTLLKNLFQLYHKVQKSIFKAKGLLKVQRQHIHAFSREQAHSLRKSVTLRMRIVFISKKTYIGNKKKKSKTFSFDIHLSYGHDTPPD